MPVEGRQAWQRQEFIKAISLVSSVGLLAFQAPWLRRPFGDEAALISVALGLLS